MASGFLEVQGFSTALAAMDAMCKTADIRVVAVDANNTTSDKTAAVPVVMQVKLKGSVSAVNSALESGYRTAQKYLPEEFILSHCIAAEDDGIKGILNGGKLPSKRGFVRKKLPAALAVVDMQCFSNAIVALDLISKNTNVEIIDVKKYMGGQMVTLVLGGSVSDVTMAVEQAKTCYEGFAPLKNALVISGPHKELFRFIG